MTLTDDQLTRAVTSAAEGIDVPEWDGLDLPVQAGLWHRRGTKWIASAAAAVVVAAVVASLGSSGPAGQSSADRASSGGGVKAPADGPGTGYASGGGTAGGGLPVAGPALVPPVVDSGASGSTGSTGGTAAGGAAPDSARIVKTGSISLTVDEAKVTATMARLRTVAKQARGYLSDEQTQNVGSSPSGTVTMRVPVGAFESVVAQVSSKGFGAKVVSVESSGTDVTAQYADTAAQIASLKAARSRYLSILNAAKTVAEILSVQQRIDDVQGQMDQLEGSRRVLANQSDLATLTVSVNQKGSQILISPERSGWSKAWHDAGHGFTGGIQWLVAHSGRGLLVLLVGIACIALGRGGWRVARRRLI